MKEPPGNRERPPETEEEHKYIWDAAERSHRMWGIGGGALYAAFTNWKVWLSILGVVAYIRNADIIAIAQKWLGP